MNEIAKTFKESKYIEGTTAIYKENFAFLMYSDSKNKAELAKRAKDNGNASSENLFSRLSIITILLAFEAFINTVYQYMGYEKFLKKNVSLKNRWLKAPEICLKNIQYVDKSKIRTLRGMNIHLMLIWK